jgi:predicted nucleotidyltransferase
MDKTKAIILLNKYVKEVLKHFSPQQIVLFGSYANNTAGESSDIDVAVIFNGFEGDFLEDSALLWQLTEEISFLIEPILLDKTQDPDGFVNHVLATGETIYKQS